MDERTKIRGSEMRKSDQRFYRILHTLGLLPYREFLPAISAISARPHLCELSVDRRSRGQHVRCVDAILPDRDTSVSRPSRTHTRSLRSLRDWMEIGESELCEGATTTLKGALACARGHSKGDWGLDAHRTVTMSQCLASSTLHDQTFITKRSEW